MDSKPSLGQIVGDAWRLLTFRLSAERIAAFGGGHLVLGLVLTWLVGMGRYWDDPRAELAQRLGLGSVVYVFVLAELLYLIVKPLTHNPDWTYWHVLTYVTLVAPPAALYAIPIERYVPLAQASEINVWFLAVVAVWRVALMFRLYSVFGGLRWFPVVVTGLLPLTLIVTSLLFLNLQHVVYDIMGGFRDPSSADGAYEVVMFLTFISVFAFPVLGVIYLWMAATARTERWTKDARSAVEDDGGDG